MPKRCTLAVALVPAQGRAIRTVPCSTVHAVIWFQYYVSSLSIVPRRAVLYVLNFVGSIALNYLQTHGLSEFPKLNYS